VDSRNGPRTSQWELHTTGDLSDVPTLRPFPAGRRRAICRYQPLDRYRDGAASNYSRSYLHDLETGVKQPTIDTGARLDGALSDEGQLSTLVTARVVMPAQIQLPTTGPGTGRMRRSSSRRAGGTG
jgi:hypothetical protein